MQHSPPAAVASAQLLMVDDSPSFIIGALSFSSGWLYQLLLTVPLCNLLRYSLHDSMSASAIHQPPSNAHPAVA
jgi:hypothetical protein